MTPPIFTRKVASERLLVVVFAVLVAGFVGAAVVTQWMSAHVAALSGSLARSVIPDIAHVSALRDATLDVQLALADLGNQSGEDREHARSLLDARLARLQEETRRDLTLAGAFSPELSSTLHDFETAIERTRSILERDPVAGLELFQSDLLPASKRLGDRAMQEVAVDAHQGRKLAVELEKTRGRVIRLAYVMIAFTTIVAGIGFVLLRRHNSQALAAVGKYARDQEARTRDHQIKASEMEEFAGRVAHDIRGTLATASLAADMIAERGGEMKSVVGRLQRSLARAASIIDGLLAFARAGGSPEPGARADLREVIHDTASELGPELEQAAIELRVEPVPPVMVRCSTGVLDSLVGNLVRNAIKYMGTGSPREIAIRAEHAKSAVRVEVSDTGPGVPDDLLPRLFEPYFRGTTHQTGLGLGLATVRKLAEGHGGRVGARSEVGKGSTFWFELPYAGKAWDASDVHAMPTPEAR